MGRWKPKEERLELGAKVAYLRDVKKLRWRVIAKRLGVRSVPLARVYYKNYKEPQTEEPPGLSIEKIQTLAASIGVEPGWVWLYENGFKHRVPPRVRERIEDGKLGKHVKEVRHVFRKRGRRGRPRKYAGSAEVPKDFEEAAARGA